LHGLIVFDHIGFLDQLDDLFFLSSPAEVSALAGFDDATNAFAAIDLAPPL